MPSELDFKHTLQAFQSQRLRRDHADLADEPQYRLIAEFFFQEMYSPNDFSARDQQAQRLYQFVNLVPGLATRDIKDVLELLELTNHLDDAIAAQLSLLAATLEFDEITYERAYQLCNNYDDRMRQIELSRSTLYNVYRMARKPLIGAVLQRTQALAQAVGMTDIHRFVRLGRQAILPVRDIHRFVETILLREQDRLERIYAV
ncbi:MAG: hypothetical protein M3R61_15040 [Chloroflexota bacterium]|nr:hypothetical protein [Chloroflexota bacterium]